MWSAWFGRGAVLAPVDLRVGSVLDLPFADATFDCVWCANVVQYLTEAEFTRVLGEFRRVTKPGGIVAVKDFDATILQILPLDPAIHARLIAARRAKAAETGLLGISCGPFLGPFFRQAGLTDLVRKSWLVERWAPPPPPTRQFVTLLLRRQAGCRSGARRTFRGSRSLAGCRGRPGPPARRP